MKLINIKKFKTAVILCGGKGTRLGSITKKIPKSLVKIKKKPIMWYILKILKRNGFNQFILPLGYKGNLIERYLKNKDFKNYNIKVASTGNNTPIAKRIHQVKKHIVSENFLLLNGDAIFDLNLNKIYKEHIKNKKTFITFLGSETNLPYGTILMSKGLVKNFARDVMFNAVKISNKNDNIAHIYSGMAILNKKILTKNIKNYKNFEVNLYPRIIKKYKCKFQKFSGFWHSIDNVKDIKVLKNNKEKRKKINDLLKKLK